MRRVRTAWHDNDMHVVGHQAIRQYAAFRVFQMLAHEREVHLVVGGGVGHPLAVGSSLGDVMGKAGLNAARIAGHTTKQCHQTSNLLKGPLESGTFAISCKESRQAVPATGHRPPATGVPDAICVF